MTKNETKTIDKDETKKAIETAIEKRDTKPGKATEVEAKKTDAEKKEEKANNPSKLAQLDNLSEQVKTANDAVKLAESAVIPMAIELGKLLQLVKENFESRGLKVMDFEAWADKTHDLKKAMVHNYLKLFRLREDKKVTSAGSIREALASTRNNGKGTNVQTPEFTHVIRATKGQLKAHDKKNDTENVALAIFDGILSVLKNREKDEKAIVQELFGLLETHTCNLENIETPEEIGVSTEEIPA